MNARPVAVRQASPALKFLELLVALVVVGAVAQGLWSATRSASVGHADHETGPLPARLAGLSLESWSAGPDAMLAVEGLHGLDVGIIDASIGYYERQTTVWVGLAGDEEQAAEMVARMTSAIIKGNPAFAYAGRANFGGFTVHQVRAGGELHFYYQNGVEVIWVAARPGAGPEFISQVVGDLR
jgi:hypothetical protein